jgi:radical SAM superfamily enzyme YgiQ (UPF0313 family)
VSLISPPYLGSLTSSTPREIHKKTGIAPPLGLAYVAAALETEKISVEIIDMEALQLNGEQLQKKLEEKNPDVVGITCTSATVRKCLQIARLTKDCLSDVTVVIGGPHVSVLPNVMIQCPEIDVEVRGEGEYTTLALINALERGKTLESIQGIAYKKNDQIFINPNRPPIENLDSIPFPARHLLPNEKYCNPLARRLPLTTMITSRGCPFDCLFCEKTYFGRKFRARSPENVVNEIEQVKKDINVQEIFLYDDTFTIDRKRVMKICDEIVRRNLKISWDCRTRVDCVDRDLLFKMREAGCERIHYGVESADQKVLDTLRKGITLKQVKEAFKWTKEAGISILAYFMIGSPGDTRETIRKTIDISKKLDPDYVFYSVTTIYPGTDMHRYAVLNNYVEPDFWVQYSLGKTNDIPAPVFETREFSREDLENIVYQAYKEFYMRPKFVFKKLLNVKSWQELKFCFQGATTLLGLHVT